MLEPTTIPLALYVHLPWCVRKCPYCDFNSHEHDGALPEAAYVDALRADLATEVNAIGERSVGSIFIGGGTPSLFSGSAIARLLEALRDELNLMADAEITLEANPGTVDAGNFSAYRAAGVNRLSIGVQSLRDAQLKALGRVHDKGDAVRALEVARSAGFTNINLDLMHGLPADEADDALRDLAQAIALAPEHLSWYQLTLEPGTAFGRRPPPLPPHDRIAEEFERGCAMLETAGYQRYEVSAFARMGRESRHNLNYWEFGDYLGIGAGAHGKLSLPEGVRRTVRRRHPAAYMKEAGSAAATTTELIQGPPLITEFALNALRLKSGFARELFTSRTGLLATALDAGISAGFARGWLAECDSRLVPTPLGYRFLNDLQLLFVP